MSSAAGSEPAPAPGRAPFEERDFHALSERHAADPEANDRRLSVRRKLAAIAKAIVPRARERGVALDTRTSLHHPHAFNGMRVRRLWAYLTRPKAEKTKLRRVLGAELAKDLDSAYRNGYLCVAIEESALEVSLRIHPDAWYDGQNLAKRVAAQGSRELLGLLRELDGFQLRLHDWKGEWRCSGLEPERLDELFGFYVPGEHGLAVERRFPASGAARAAALGDKVPAMLADEVLRLLPVYRFALWSKESDFLFS